MTDTYDVVVLGTGAGGLAAAVTAAALGASVGVFEKTGHVGGTTAVSGGVAWIPAHDRPDAPVPLPVEDALTYLGALSNGTIDEHLAEVYVRSAGPAVRFLEAHTPLRLSVTEGFPDYKPELPGGKAAGGRSLSPAPFDFAGLGEWAGRVTAFPNDYSNVGFDAETRARIWGGRDPGPGADVRLAGAALVGSLLRGLLDLGVTPQTSSRAVELVLDAGAVTGVVLETPESRRQVHARRGVVIATGGFEWDPALVKAFLRGPMHGPTSPPNNTGDGLRMAMRAGASLGNMAEAWWVPIVRIPGDTHGGRQRHRSVRLERTRPRSIMVNRHGRRFANEAGDYHSLGGAFHQFDPARFEYPNLPAWIVFDREHLVRYGFLGVSAGDAVPEWFHESASLAELAGRLGVDGDALGATVATWNRHTAELRDPDFGRGRSSYDGHWGDTTAATLAERTLGPIDAPPYYAVAVDIGAMGTKGGPRTDDNGQVLDLDGRPIGGLYAAGNAMAGTTGMAYGGAGGTIGPALTWGHRAARHAVTGSKAATA
ncbi:FAD-dependent oxidoreductase [Dactylosporangium sp. AC04546]|uniref:FAD-dependent oxidoreductase n=1 Tax=Dactylosporangium sp. AC04546 TaxID=2862460 RepID=UPI001EDD5952|nr:FAD-dependent oxidoreductase [Dactylosporangium sp. AC04546]WVK78476.1 FAD-dependent oxidoreductase [Dactylosporangium sp. AC04546]